MLEVYAAGVLLPAPTEISASDELLWTSDTGRTLSGLMVGDIICAKDTVSLSWKWLTRQQYETISAAIKSAQYFSFKIPALGIDMECYRGAITKVPKDVGGALYYAEVGADFIER